MPLAPRDHDAACDDLHARLLVGEPGADEAACAYLRPRLVRLLQRHRFPGEDGHLVESAVDEALFRYVRAPARFNPSRGDLERWLLANALNRLRDLRRTNRRWTDHEIAASLDVTKLEAPAPADEHAAARERVAELIALLPNPADRAFVEARLRGESRQGQAAALGVHMDDEEALAEILAAAWDRIRHWLRRRCE